MLSKPLLIVKSPNFNRVNNSTLSLCNAQYRDFATFGVVGAIIGSVLAVRSSLARLQATYFYDTSDDRNMVKERLNNMQFRSLILKVYAQQKYLQTNKRDPVELLLQHMQHDKDNLVQAYNRERRKRQRAIAYSWIVLALSASSLPMLSYQSTVFRPLALSLSSVLATAELGHLGGKCLGGLFAGMIPKNSYMAFGAASAAVLGLVISPFSIAASVFSVGPNVFIQQSLVYTQLICAASIYGLYYLPVLSKESGIIPTGIEMSSAEVGKFSLSKTARLLRAHWREIVQAVKYNSLRFSRWLKLAKENRLKGFRYTLFTDYCAGRVLDDSILNSIRAQLLAIPDIKQRVIEELHQKVEQGQQIDVLVPGQGDEENLNDMSLVHTASYTFKRFVDTTDVKIGFKTNGIEVWGYITVKDESDPLKRGYLLFNGTFKDIVPVTRDDLKDSKFDAIFGASEESLNKEIIITKELPNGVTIVKTDFISNTGGRKIYWKRGDERGVSGWKPASNEFSFNEVYFVPANVLEAGVLDRQNTGAYSVCKSLFTTIEFFYAQPLIKRLI